MPDEFTRDCYREMGGTARCILFMKMFMEMEKLAQCMTQQDYEALKKVCGEVKGKYEKAV